MASRTTTLAVIPFLLVACGDDKPPGTTSSAFDARVSDIAQNFDGTTSDDVPTTGDGSVAQDVGGMDASTDGTATDLPTADTADAAADRVMPGPTFCTLMPEQMNAFATRFALCAGRAAQQALNEFWRPESWEGGALATRPCPSLLCAATERGNCSTVFDSCLKYRETRAAGGTCPTPAFACEGTPPRVAVACRDGVTTRNDCATNTTVPSRCVASGTDVACVPSAGTACAAGSPARCNGTVLERCILGTYTPVRNCGLSGSVCDAAGDTCRGSGAACTGDAVACEGTQLRVCRGGATQLIDCGRLVPGASCQTVNGHAFCGVAAECDPTVAAANGTCDGGTLVLCGGGRTYRFDCTLYGYTACGASGCTM